MGERTEVVAAGSMHGATLRPLTLEVSTGPDAGQRLEGVAGAVSVGSAEGNVLRLADSTVSKFHLELAPGADGWQLRDLDSTNGTRLNGVRVREAWLPDAATVAIGETVLRIATQGETVTLPLHPEVRFEGLLGSSVAMRAVFAQLDRLAPTRTTVLVEGESGTGKELVAEALHRRSPRAKGPFIIVDCGSIPPELVESELFGHERGAFTGATHERKGAFEAADGGTLFLDEIGELPLAMQPRLLRALERRQIKRVGATEHRTVDVRFVCATHRDLRKAVNAGAFREDLFFRVAVAVVRLPPLRERPEDLPLLLHHLWTDTVSSLGLAGEPFVEPSPETLRALSALPWEGNVRALRNFVERSVALSGVLDARLLQPPAAASPAQVRYDLPYGDAKEAWLEQFERAYLARRLEQAGGNVSRMAREADMDRAHLIKLLRKQGLGRRGDE